MGGEENGGEENGAGHGGGHGERCRARRMSWRQENEAGHGGHGDDKHLLEGESDPAKDVSDVEELQAELTQMQSMIWENEDITEEEAEALERQSTLLKIKLVEATTRIKEWGMQTGMERLASFQEHRKWFEDKTESEGGVTHTTDLSLLKKLLPMAIFFMLCVIGASQIHFDDSKPIPGNLFPLEASHPIVWPMAHAEAVVEARIHIQSSTLPGSHGGHRRRHPTADFRPSFLHNNHKWNTALRTATSSTSMLPASTTHDAHTHAAPTLPARDIPPDAAASDARTLQARHAPMPPEHDTPPYPPSGPPEVTPAARRLESTAQPLPHNTILPPTSARTLLQLRPPVPSVPEPWVSRYDEASNHYFFWNTVTGATTWSKPPFPAGFSDSTPTAPPPSTPPPGPPPAPPSGGVHGEGHGGSPEGGRGSYDAVIDVWLFDFKDSKWGSCARRDYSCYHASAKQETLLGRYKIKQEEQRILMDIFLSEDPKNQYVIVLSEHAEPLAVAIQMHSLGWTGRGQIMIATVIMVLLFGMIMTEVMHRTMASMIGAALCLMTLAVQNRVPTLSKVVGWMDHGTLGLLWGMMLIVGITMRTGVFEWTGVLACKLSKGDKTQLLLLLCGVTSLLSAFLDNVTTILLICPVTCKLCKLVNMDPRPYLICEAIFSNLGGTGTMIGDPPNIIIGNMLAKYLDFNAFLFNLGPGVCLSCVPCFQFLVYFFKDNVVGELVVDIPKMERMYPITDRPLLIKCGTVLSCVIASFFLHPLTHLDPAWIAIMGAVWLLVAFDMHHCHEALMGVEWDTLLFFAALFVVVEGVSEMGLLRYIATMLSSMVATVGVAGRQYFSIALIMWASAIFSAFVDNIPFTATMVPVMMQLTESVEGVSLRPLAWALAFGACFGGNGTLIGASANIVMASKAESEGWHISFVDFIKVGMPILAISVSVANIYLFILNAAFWQGKAGLDNFPSLGLAEAMAQAAAEKAEGLMAAAGGMVAAAGGGGH